MDPRHFTRPFLSLLTVILLLAAPPLSASGGDGRLLARRAMGEKSGIVIEKLSYLSGGLKVRGLLFTPRHEGGARLPCVIFCHDGISGISREHRLSSIRLARMGYAVFCPSYRGEDGSEGTVEIAKGEVTDVLSAMKLCAGLDGIEGSRMALAGASHGALICVLAAARTSEPKALVAVYGVMDIYRWWQYLRDQGKLGADGISTRTYGKGPDDRPLSFQIRNGLGVAGKIKCPVLILQGEKDTTVPAEQARLLRDELLRHGISVEMEIYPHCAHGFLIYVPWLPDRDILKGEREETEKAWKTMEEFLERHLKQERSPCGGKAR
ncbi:MAG: dienelactone hydrolase family protein [Candidatus Eremiobacteraeota bacterium]|nr:dienelactone hydrolase family protein [Candidatus Eremiobacteraeota bacterium]